MTETPMGKLQRLGQECDAMTEDDKAVEAVAPGLWEQQHYEPTRLPGETWDSQTYFLKLNYMKQAKAAIAAYKTYLEAEGIELKQRESPGYNPGWFRSSLRMTRMTSKREELEQLAYDWGMYPSDGFIDAILGALREPTEGMLEVMHEWDYDYARWLAAIDYLKREKDPNAS